MTPPDAVGKPSLVLFSDGSEIAYGAAAYIRWELSDGGFWCRLIMAKSRIAPMSRINIPQMELNGAVLSKRLRQSILAETRIEFGKIFHFIDSETVLYQLGKIAQRFNVYEGVRIGEIQSATRGDMSEWFWVAGSVNVGDLTTRPQFASALGPDSEWQRGPAFLYSPEAEWDVKPCPVVSDPQLSPGEKPYSFAARTSGRGVEDFVTPVLKRCSTVSKAVGAVARCLSALRNRSFRGGASASITPELRQSTLHFLISHVQRLIWPEESKLKLQFRVVNPEIRDGLWVIGLRISHTSPLTPDNRPQILLPRDHLLTRKLMIEAHESSHGGRDVTLAKFRSKYYTSKAPQLASHVCSSCFKCRLLKVKLRKQKMGMMPPERLVPAPPFTTCVLDLFGPFLVRGEVNKRVNMKVWGAIIVDLVCRAVHIEVTAGYDTKSFLVAFRRFASVRGYPSVIYSDPGTQLVGASKELRALWDNVKTESALTSLSKNGSRWEFGPADSPWYQGAAESLIKSAKRAFLLSVGNNEKLSFSELLTSFTEVANILNERPIGFMPSTDNEINVLTPNLLLLGRSACRNPGGYEFPAETSIFGRVNLVQDVVDAFWKNWTQLYAPTLLQQSKWRQEERPLSPGDIVLVADQNVVRGEYRVAEVHEVHPSKDGIVRRVSVRYKLYRSMSKDFKLVDGRDQIVERSVQRLSMLVPIAER